MPAPPESRARVFDRGRVARAIVPVLGVAIAYSITGRLGLRLAVPPGFATPIWPPSGIALAALILFGERVAPGVWLGSFSINLGLALGSHAPQTLPTACLVAGSIALGATLQALAGSRLARIWIGAPFRLQTERQVAALLFLVAPIGCLVAATWSVSTLGLAGVVSWTNLPFNWFAWWVGDTMGVIVVTPLALLLGIRREEVPARGKISLAIPLLVLFGLVVTLFVCAGAWERERTRREFENLASDQLDEVRGAFDRDLEVLYSVRSLWAGSSDIEAHEFGAFVRPLLARHRTLAAAAFDIVVPPRDATSSGAAGVLGPVKAVYIEPVELDPAALGADIRSTPERFEALEKACDGGQPVATPPFHLERSGTGPAFLVYLAIYDGRPATVAERRAHLRGFVAGLFRIRSMVNASVRSGSIEAVSMRLATTDARGLPITVDPGAPRGARADPRSTDAPGLVYRQAIDLAGRSWQFEFVPTNAYAMRHRNWEAWVVLAAGLLFTGLLGGALLIAIGRTALIERVVADRTGELTRTNTELHWEIDERQKVERELSRRTSELSAIIRAFPDLHFRVGPDGTVLDLSTSQAFDTGLAPETVLGRPIHEVLPPLLREPFESALRRAQHSRSPVAIEYALPSGGANRWYEGRWMPMPDGTIFVIVREITDRKLAELELRDRAAELARSNAELEQFAYVASHDLQEPLRMVSSFVQLLARRYRGKLDAEADEYIQFAVQGTHRMQSLILDLLTYSRIGRVKAVPHRVDCEAVVDEVLLNLKPALEEAQARVTRGPLPELVVESTQLGQLFQNLLSNALKFRGGTPPEIEIGARSADNVWEFWVRDNGIGIEPQYAERIFGVFQRLHTRDAYPGTGIGLAICRKIVEQQGGRIWVESTFGTGSTFRFTLPRTEEAIDVQVA